MKKLFTFLFLIFSGFAFANPPGTFQPLLLASSSAGPTFVRAANNVATSGSFTTDSVTVSTVGTNFCVGVTANLGGGIGMVLPVPLFDGVAMTAVAGSPFGPSGDGSAKIAISYILNPNVGASKNYTISWTTAQSRLQSGVICFSGAAGTVSDIQFSSVGATLTITSAINKIVVAAIAAQTQTDHTLSTSGATTDWHQASLSSFAAGAGHIPGASSVGVTWSAIAGGEEVVAFNVD